MSSKQRLQQQQQPGQVPEEIRKKLKQLAAISAQSYTDFSSRPDWMTYQEREGRTATMPKLKMKLKSHLKKQATQYPCSEGAGPTDMTLSNPIQLLAPSTSSINKKRKRSAVRNNAVQSLIEVLKKPVAQRGSTETAFQVVPFLQQTAFVKERGLKKDDIDEIAKTLEYEMTPGGLPVYRYGEPGDTFFIIISGTVSVWVPMKSSSMKGPIAKFKAQIKSNAAKPGSSSNKVDFKFPLSLVRNVIEETSESSNFCSSFEDEDGNLSVDLTSEEDDKCLGLEKSWERMSAKPIEWCTYGDFCKFVDDTSMRQQNWNLFLREKALETIFEVEKYLVRNKQPPQPTSPTAVATTDKSTQIKKSIERQFTRKLTRKLTRRGSILSRGQTRMPQDILSGSSRRIQFAMRQFQISGEDFTQEVEEELFKVMGTMRQADSQRRQSIIYKEIVPHQFMVEGATFEWMDGRYFKKVSVKGTGEGFGSDVLISPDSIRNATVRAEGEDAVMVTMSRENFNQSLKKVEKLKSDKMVDFMRNIPYFATLYPRQILEYSQFLQPVSFTRGQTVYREGTPTKSVFIVKTGEFELGRQIAKAQRTFSIDQRTGKLHQQASSQLQQSEPNILAKRLPEIKDVPANFRVSIFSTGALMGEDDVVRNGKYSGTLRCTSATGTVFELTKETFTMLIEEAHAWDSVKEKSRQNKERLSAQHLCNSPPRDFTQEIKQTKKFLEEAKLVEFSSKGSEADRRPHSLSAGKHFSISSQTAGTGGNDLRNMTSSPKDKSTFSAFSNAILNDLITRNERRRRSNLANISHGIFPKALSTTNMMIRIAENDDSTGSADGKVNVKRSNKVLFSGPNSSTRIDQSLMTPSVVIQGRNSQVRAKTTMQPVRFDLSKEDSLSECIDRQFLMSETKLRDKQSLSISLGLHGGATTLPVKRTSLQDYTVNTKKVMSGRKSTPHRTILLKPGLGTIKRGKEDSGVMSKTTYFGSGFKINRTSRPPTNKLLFQPKSPAQLLETDSHMSRNMTQKIITNKTTSAFIAAVEAKRHLAQTPNQQSTTFNNESITLVTEPVADMTSNHDGVVEEPLSNNGYSSLSRRLSIMTPKKQTNKLVVKGSDGGPLLRNSDKKQVVFNAAYLQKLKQSDYCKTCKRKSLLAPPDEVGAAAAGSSIPTTARGDGLYSKNGNACDKKNKLPHFAGYSVLALIQGRLRDFREK